MSLLLAALVVGSLPGLDENGLSELITRHGGKVLVVNFWATWCGPCREELPLFVRLDQERGKDGVAVVLISMDEEQDNEKAAQVLLQEGARFTSFIRDFADFAEFVDRIDPNWSGALPATFVFNKEGSLVLSKIGMILEAELRSVVDAALVDRDSRNQQGR